MSDYVPNPESILEDIRERFPLSEEEWLTEGPAYLYLFFIWEGGEEFDFNRFLKSARYMGVSNKKRQDMRWRMHGQIASGAWIGQGGKENKHLSHILRKTWDSQSESEVRVLTLTLRGRSRVYGEVCEAASIHYLLLLGTPLTNIERGYCMGLSPTPCS